MRVLNMKVETHKQLYKILYEGIMASRRTFTDLEARTLVKVLDKLEEFGQLEGEGNSATYALTLDGAVILEDAEFELMRDTFRKVAWTARGVRDATKVTEWLNQIPETKAAQLAAT